MIEVERNGVCDDKNIGCSSGLHAGSVQYATDFGAGGKVVLVEINPADVVSVPEDCNCQKLRACKYKVVGEYEIPLNDHYHNGYSKEDWNNNYNEDVGDDYNDHTETDTETYDGSNVYPKSFIDSQTIKTETEEIESVFDSLFQDKVAEKTPEPKHVANPAQNIADAATKLREFAASIGKVVEKATEPKPVELTEEQKLKNALQQLTETLKNRLKSL